MSDQSFPWAFPHDDGTGDDGLSDALKRKIAAQQQAAPTTPPPGGEATPPRSPEPGPMGGLPPVPTAAPATGIPGSPTGLGLPTVGGEQMPTYTTPDLTATTPQPEPEETGDADLFAFALESTPDVPQDGAPYLDDTLLVDVLHDPQTSPEDSLAQDEAPVPAEPAAIPPAQPDPPQKKGWFKRRASSAATNASQHDRKKPNKRSGKKTPKQPADGRTTPKGWFRRRRNHPDQAAGTATTPVKGSSGLGANVNDGIELIDLPDSYLLDGPPRDYRNLSGTRLTHYGEGHVSVPLPPSVLTRRVRNRRIAKALLYGFAATMVTTNAFLAWDVYATKLTLEEETQRTRALVGIYNYPLANGMATAAEVAQNYLHVSNNTEGRAARERLARLNSRIGDKGAAGGDQGNSRRPTGAYVQELVNPVVLQDYKVFNNNRAYFEFRGTVRPGVQVGDQVARKNDPEVEMAVGITVYCEQGQCGYDPETSPSLVPVKARIAANDLPDARKPGNGVLVGKPPAGIHDMVMGYMQGYATASPDNISSIAQYITKDASVGARDGFNGTFELAGDPNDAIKYEVYGCDDNEEDTSCAFKILVDSRWRLTAGSEGESVDFPSSLVLHVTKQGDKHLISTVARRTYNPVPDAKPVLTSPGNDNPDDA